MKRRANPETLFWLNKQTLWVLWDAPLPSKGLLNSTASVHVPTTC